MFYVISNFYWFVWMSFTSSAIDVKYVKDLFLSFIFWKSLLRQKSSTILIKCSTHFLNQNTQNTRKIHQMNYLLINFINSNYLLAGISLFFKHLILLWKALKGYNNIPSRIVSANSKTVKNLHRFSSRNSK